MPSSSITLEIPPAHSISEFALPSTLERRITEEHEEEADNSSEEDSRPVEVVENVRFKLGVGASASTINVGHARRFSLRGPRRDNSGSNTTSSSTGTGTGSFTQHTSTPPSQSATHLSLRHGPFPAPIRERRGSGGFFSSIAGLFRGSGNTGSGGTEKWRTRTAANVRAVRRGADSDSEDEDVTESPSRRFFGRRVSHDLSPPPSPSPTPQKLRKRSVREKDRDGGWISDGATVAGRGARKGSMKQRPQLSSGASPSTSAHKRSASVASVTPSFVSASGSSTPTRAKPKSKPKADLRVETLSRSNTDVSRKGILRSSDSVPPPPVPKVSGPEQRTSNLPPSRSAMGSSLSRNSSLSHYGKSSSTVHVSAPPPPSHVDAGRGGTSLLAIVESVTRDNRAAWDRANSGLPSESSDGVGSTGGLVSVRAPPSVTKYNVRGDGGQGISFESVLAPGSVFATPPPSASVARSGSKRHTSLPPPPRAPISTTPAATSTPPKIPLRSALRAQSPPLPPPKPIVIPSAPPRIVVEAQDAAPSVPNGRDNHNDDGDDEDSDSGSFASFRTVRETLDDSPTPTLPPSAPAPAPPAPPGKEDSDVSASTASLSTETGAGVARRKSVRMSLQPTFSPTPPALDEDEDVAWGRSGRPWGVVGNGSANGVSGKERERDFWADSSDEDEEYANARKLLMRTGKKRW